MFYDGKYFVYDNTYTDVKYLMMFINRLLHPMVYLKTEQEVNTFMNNSLVIKDYNTKFFKNYLKVYG